MRWTHSTPHAPPPRRCPAEGAGTVSRQGVSRAGMRGGGQGGPPDPVKTHTTQACTLWSPKRDAAAVPGAAVHTNGQQSQSAHICHDAWRAACAAGGCFSRCGGQRDHVGPCGLAGGALDFAHTGMYTARAPLCLALLPPSSRSASRTERIVMMKHSQAKTPCWSSGCSCGCVVPVP